MWHISPSSWCVYGFGDDDDVDDDDVQISRIPYLKNNPLFVALFSSLLFSDTTLSFPMIVGFVVSVIKQFVFEFSSVPIVCVLLSHL